MKNFVCSNCGNTVKRPSAPLKCDACGQGRVGLFKAADGGAKPAMNIAPPPPPLEASAPPPSARPASSAPPAAKPQAPKTTAPPFVPPPVKPASPAKPATPAPVAKAPPSSTPKPASTSRAAGYRLDDDDDAPPGASPARSSTPTSRAPAPTSRAPAQVPSGYAADPAPASRKTSPMLQTSAAPGGPGSILWTYPQWLPGQGVAVAALRNCPAADGKGRLFAAVGSVVAGLAEENGQLRVLWEYKTGGHIPGSPALGRDGRLRVHSNDGKLHCITDAGEAGWTPTSVGEPLGWASPLVDNDDYTWVCAYAGGLLKIDSRGTKGSTPYYRTRQKFDSTGVIHDGVFFVGSEDGFVYAVDLKGHKGKLAWDPLQGHGKTDWFINSAPAVGGGGLIVAGRDEHLYAFRFEGTQLWETHLRGQMLASPVVDDQGDIYVCVSLEQRGEPAQGKLVCVTGDPPRVKWEYRAQGAVESTPVVGSDGLIYFGDNAGVVHAVSRDGRAEWTQSVGSAVRSAGAIFAPGRLVFGTDDGQLVCLRCSSEGLPTRGWPKYMRNLSQCAGG